MKIEKQKVNDRKSHFESIKAKVIEHLEKLENEEKRELKKSFMFALLGKGGKGLPVGTIREWKGKKFIKVAPGKWRPKYDSHTKGAKLAISALKKKIVACKDEHEMMQIILENRDRFTDSRGNPLPFVQELYKFIIEEQNSEKRVSPDEAHRNRSDAMKGNKNAKKQDLNSLPQKTAIIPEVPQEKLEKYLDKAVNESIEYHASYFEDIYKNWLDWGNKKFPDEYIKKYNLSRDIIPTEKEIEVVFEDHFREKEIKRAIETANIIRSKNIYEIYDRCVNTIGWRDASLFELITSNRIKDKSKKEALNIIKKYAGKDEEKKYEKKLKSMQEKEKEETELKKLQKKEKEKKEVIENIKDSLRARNGEKENQQIAEDFYDWANSQSALTRGKIIKYFTSNKKIRYVINGEERIGSRIDFIYDVVIDGGYNIIDKKNKRIENDEGRAFEFTQTDFVYGEHLVNNKDVNKELNQITNKSSIEEKKKKALEYGFDLSNYYPPFSNNFQEADLDNDLYLCDRLSEVIKEYDLKKEEIRAFTMDIHLNGGYRGITPSNENKWEFYNIIIPHLQGTTAEQGLLRLGFEKTREMFNKMLIEYKNILNEKNKKLQALSNILETGKSLSVKHKELGEIIIDAGSTGKSGYGLKHIIEQRYKKDGKNEDEITALLYLIQDTLKDGKIKKNDSNYAEIIKYGIMAVVSKQRHGEKENWLLTGYELYDEKERATDAIKAVIAQYDYTLEYSGLNRQVGAVIASLGKNISNSSEKGKMKKSISYYEPSQSWKKAMAELKAVYNL